MTDYDIIRLAEIPLYVVSQCPGISQYNLYKVLYFAEKKHLAEYGMEILPTDYYAWQCGPVPKKIYHAIKHPEGSNPEDIQLAQAITQGSDDTANLLFPLREPRKEYISKTELNCLDTSIRENAHLSFGELMRKSHDKAWSNAYGKNPGKQVIPKTDMALAQGAPIEIADYINEMKELKSLLS